MKPQYYFCLLHFFHSTAFNLKNLTDLWITLCLASFQKYLVQINSRVIIIADGIKASKEGRKMPAVKKLHQESNNNSKAEYIFGHYIESLALVAEKLGHIIAIPLLARIHDGIIFSEEDRKLTIIDRFIILLNRYLKDVLYYLTADSYYIAKKLMSSLVQKSNHIITRMRSNAVAWEPLGSKKSKLHIGRPKLYGKKIYIRDFFNNLSNFKTVQFSVYNEKRTKIKIRSEIVLLRPFALKVKVVLVVHPVRGKIILVTTDLNLPDLAVLKIYSYRFKIEVSFRASKHQFGTYAYHFWMKLMKKTARKTGDQDVSNETQKYKARVKRKLKAISVYIQLGMIAHGLLQYLSFRHPKLIWKQSKTWYRSMNMDIPPPERIVSHVLRDSFHSFLRSLPPDEKWKKLLIKRLDFSHIKAFNWLNLQEI